MSKPVTEEHLPPQVIKAAQGRFLREYEANPGPWMAKVPNYRTILEEGRKKGSELDTSCLMEDK